MNVSAENVETDETKQPKNQKNNKDSPKHINLSVGVVTNGSFRRAKPRVAKSDFERSPRRIRVAAATGTIFYRPAFLRTARKSQLLSSSCARAEL